MKVKAVIMDPEIVFVANLTSADAPALKVSFQCDFSLTSDKLAQRMTAQVKAFKVLACAFLKEKQGKNVTTVRKTVFHDKKIIELVAGVSIALKTLSFHITDYSEERRGLYHLRVNLLSVGGGLEHLEFCLKPVLCICK